MTVRTELNPHHTYYLQPMRPLEEIWADILDLERETEGLLGGIMVAQGRQV